RLEVTEQCRTFLEDKITVVESDDDIEGFRSSFSNVLPTQFQSASRSVQAAHIVVLGPPEHFWVEVDSHGGPILVALHPWRGDQRGPAKVFSDRQRTTPRMLFDRPGCEPNLVVRILYRFLIKRVLVCSPSS